VVTVGVKGVVVEAAGRMGKEGGGNGQVKAVDEAQLVVRGGKAVVGVLVGEIVEGKGHHGVGKGGQVGANMARGAERGGESGEVLFLEAAVQWCRQ
jgi:hypothetical protein